MFPLLIYYLFGERLDMYKKNYDNLLLNPKRESDFLHIASKDRLSKILCVEDVGFATYFDYETEYFHVFTSMASLSDCLG